MERYQYSIAVFFVMCCVFSGSASAIKKDPVTDAYIFVGDLKQEWYREMRWGDPYELSQPLIDKKVLELQKMGYSVTVVQGATDSRLHECLMNPVTRAVVWFGHGDPNSPGSVTMFGVNGKVLVGVGDLRQWAAEKWSRINGWNGKGDPDAWLLNKCASIKEYNQKRLQRDTAGFDLEYGYFHTCHGFDTPDMVKLMMKPDAQSRFFGYRGVKVNFDETGVLQAAWLNNTVMIGDPQTIEPQRQLALKATTQVPEILAGTPVATPPVPVDNEDEDIEFIPAKTAPVGTAVPEPTSGTDRMQSEEHDEPAESRLPEIPSTDSDGEEIPFVADTGTDGNRRIPGSETGKDDDSGNESVSGDDSAAADESQTAGESDRREPPWDTDTDGFDGVYTGKLQSGTPVRLSIAGDRVRFEIEGMTLTGAVDEKGHLTAEWKGEVGEIENPNPGNLNKEKLIGHFYIDGDISGTLVLGCLSVSIGCPAVDETPQVTRESWSCSR